jgi:hypothetical protein
MVMRGDKNVGRSYTMRIDNRPFEMVELFKYWGRNLRDRYCIQKEINSRFSRECFFYHSV